MSDFYYRGIVSTSKSLMNRALIVKSFFPELEIIGGSDCDDVRHLQQSLSSLQKGEKSFQVGDGGTTLRFLLTRLSRLPGSWKIKGSHRLMERPHAELLTALEGLGCKFKLEGSELTVKSQGWQVPDYLKINTDKSSQYVSALILNSWNLDREFVINMEGDRPSVSYLQMTVELLQDLGMEIEYRDPTIRIAPGQRLLRDSIVLEPDMSSTFALASFAATNGQLIIDDFPQKSRQPDFRFVKLFQDMGIPIVVDEKGLQVKTGQEIKSVDCNIENSPDLFPVLSVLLSSAAGVSTIRGLETLTFKESDRIEKTMELLNKLGVQHEIDGVEFKIWGAKKRDIKNFSFDPDHDHRMAMAARLAKHQGHEVTIADPQVINKSFPEFYKIVGGQ